MTYQAPVKDMLFVLNHLAGLPRVAALPGFEEATPDTAQAALEESAHFSPEERAPREPSAHRAPTDERRPDVACRTGIGWHANGR